MDGTALLKVKHLRTYFTTKHGVLPAVNDISFEINRGEVLGIVGESGCGKSVMSLSIMKLIEKYGGKIQEGSSVELEGKQLLTMSDKELCALRGKEISMIFQDPMSSLNPVFSIGFQMTETIRKHRRISKREAKKVALDWLEKVGIPDPEKRIKEFPHQLSGGMRQRVIIAMALSCDPKLLIADEPTTALDVTIQAQIIDLLKRLRQDLDAAIMLITHDFGVIANMADRIVVMYAGHMIEYGTKEQIFKNPRHPYTQGLLAAVPKLNENADRLFSIKGNVPNLTEPVQGCIFCDRCTKANERCKECQPPLFIMPDGSKASCWLCENEGKEVAYEE